MGVGYSVGYGILTQQKRGHAVNVTPCFYVGSPNGTRTRVAGVRGQYPRPLDDGTFEWLGDEDSNLTRPMKSLLNKGYRRLLQELQALVN